MGYEKHDYLAIGYCTYEPVSCRGTAVEECGFQWPAEEPFS